MTIRLIGAGLGRTGTLSLRTALATLLDAPCYHMFDLRPHPEHVPVWHAAARGEAVDWAQLFQGYAAVVDWPAASFWEEIAAAFPAAVILLSTRDAQAWWKSASQTIFPATLATPADNEWRRMIDTLFANRFTTDIENEAACISAFNAHNRAVRARAPAARLVEWQPGDGWAPICAALGVDVPDLPFPHVNSTEEFKATVLSQRK